MYFKRVLDIKNRNNHKKYRQLLLDRYIAIHFAYSGKCAKFNFFNKLKLNKNSKTKILRRCILTNRNRSSIRKFNVSRIQLKSYLKLGLISGYTKSAW